MLRIADIVILAGGFAGLTWASHRTGPRRSARFLVALAAVAAAAIVVALFLVTLGYLAAVPAVATIFQWCRDLAERWVPWWLGWGCMVALTAIGVSVGRTIVRHRGARATNGDDPVVVLALGAPVAYSAAGRPGQVVVSAGMLACLNCDERRALFAHERSHLANRHHRYLFVADVSAAIPLLRPLRSHIRFALERWADEDAVVQVGSRELVARAVGRAALAQTAPAATLAAGGSGVPARVEALLDADQTTGGRAGGAVMIGAVTFFTGSGIALVQLHRLLVLAAHLCHL